MSVTERRRVSARRESLLGEAPGAFAVARFVRVTPMKARRVVDMVRGSNVDDALATLRFAPQAAAQDAVGRFFGIEDEHLIGARDSARAQAERQCRNSRYFHIETALPAAQLSRIPGAALGSFQRRCGGRQVFDP